MMRLNPQCLHADQAANLADDGSDTDTMATLGTQTKKDEHLEDTQRGQHAVHCGISKTSVIRQSIQRYLRKASKRGASLRWVITELLTCFMPNLTVRGRARDFKKRKRNPGRPNRKESFQYRSREGALSTMETAKWRLRMQKLSHSLCNHEPQPRKAMARDLKRKETKEGPWTG